MPHCPESRFSTWHSTATLLKLSTRFSSELLLFAICGEGVVVVVAVVVVVVVANRYKVRRKINNRTKFSMSNRSNRIYTIDTSSYSIIGNRYKRLLNYAGKCNCISYDTFVQIYNRHTYTCVGMSRVHLESQIDREIAFLAHTLLYYSYSFLN